MLTPIRDHRGAEHRRPARIMLDLSQVLLLGLVAAAGYLAYRGSRHDSREPPMLSNGIPIVGHLLGMMWYGVGYWTMQA